MNSVKPTTRNRVSFIIPVLNGERDIDRCLRSIRNLEVPEKAYEIIIIDNGSTDQTHHIIRECGLDYNLMPGLSVGTLRNRGASIARADYLAFVDSDVELMPGWMKHALLAFNDERVVATGCFPGIPNNSTWVQRTWDLHQRVSLSKAFLRPVSWLPSMNLVVRRDAFQYIGGFNEQLETAEDVDLCYRLGHEGTIICNPGMEAIHWGEARDLRTFWRKESWRGMGNLNGVVLHGFRWDELPSLGYPVYMLALFLLLGVSGVFDLWHWQFILSPINIGLLVSPSLFLATHTSYRAGQVRALPQLFLLYLVYGFARACSIIKERAQG